MLQRNWQLKEFDKNVVFLGDGVDVHKETIIGFNKNYIFVSPNSNAQRASSVGALAIEYANDNLAVDGPEFELTYLRKSQAEREYDEREKEKTND